MKTRLLPVLLLFAVHVAAAQPAAVRSLGAYAERVREAFEVPGLAVAIVKDGQTVVAEGFGRRSLDAPGAVDAHTRFGIASNTKAFTATALALLVEEGKLAWDAPVVRYMPGFALADPYVTRELTVRDLLVHRSGLPLGAGDLLWWPGSTFTRAEIVEKLRYLPLETSFRSAYAYDNVLYAAAGQLIEAVTGETWEAFVTRRILEKVGMADATLRAGAEETGNVARTHARVEGRVQYVPPFVISNTNPAGGISASATDMARWMTVLLDSGRVAGDGRLFAPRTTDELWSIVTPIRPGRVPAEQRARQANFSGYALGFGVRDYRGRKIVSHTGGLPGYVSQVTLVPELKLGIAVLTNAEAGEAFTALTQHVLDAYLGADDTDWLAVLETSYRRNLAETEADDARIAAARDSLSRPHLPLEKYAGLYRDAWYGDIAIAQENGGLVMRFGHTPALVGDLEHWQYDTFVARWRDRSLRADAFVTFTLTPDGQVGEARMQAVSPATDFSFDFHHLLLRPVR